VSFIEKRLFIDITHKRKASRVPERVTAFKR